jgi:hypothetical protein
MVCDNNLEYKNMMKFLYVLIYLAIPVTIYSYNLGQTVNPGIKIGYEFGANHCWVIGAEISYVVFNKNFFYGGPIVGITKRISKTGNFVPYCEFEAGWGPLGLALGIELDKKALVRHRVFAGGLLYCSYKWTMDTKDGELSGILKYYGFIKLPNGWDLM